MSLLYWAKREIAIACEKENPDKKEGEWDYGCACYESALKAFESLLGDGHSGFSIKMTQFILNRLIDGKPLTPIEDVDDVWRTAYPEDGCLVFQCKRMSSLFKRIYPDGTIKYSDNNYTYCVNIHNPSNTYYSGLVRKIIDELYPITMPYMPGKAIRVYCEDFLSDEKNGDFDTVGVFYALKNENGRDVRVEINRYFKEQQFESEESNYAGWVEIEKEEYSALKNRAKELMNKRKKGGDNCDKK